MKHRSQNRLAILRRYMDAWAQMPRHNRSVVAEIIYEEFNVSGLQEHIAGTGVEFTSSDDPHNDMRVRGQKFWRWIGAYEDAKPQPDKLFYLEQVIVSAMPEQIRTAYLAEVYASANVCIGINQGGDALCLSRIACTLIKEHGEALSSLIEMGNDAAPEKLDKTLREMRECFAAVQGAVTTLEEMRAKR